jgi:hypothetical protein
MNGEMYFSVDVEADGPIPGPYSMVSCGVSVAGVRNPDFTPIDPTRFTFYRELRPISEEWDPAALAVSRLSREQLVDTGADPAVAMAELTDFIRTTADGARPVFVAYPACYDWMFVYWYLIRFTGASIFGHSGCLDMKTLYATRANVHIGRAVKRLMPRHLHSTREHTHNALDDAVEQADLFANLMRWDGRGADGQPPAPVAG